ncbi:hypothetical protein CPC698_0676 [Chlamydia psittaci C6/98]|nr:hypothetical protein CPC698_0676 [Chlamydia psittaci C6/98]
MVIFFFIDVFLLSPLTTRDPETKITNLLLCQCRCAEDITTR